jgi:segregation and condensation protein A
MPDGARPPTESPGGNPPSEDRLWDDWETPPRVPAMPVLHLDGFDGPMDMLLDLAERQRIDLGRISVRALAEQFVAEMERVAAHVSVERRADWLVLATRLVLLHSRLLFPANPEEAAAAERDAAPAPIRVSRPTWRCSRHA